MKNLYFLKYFITKYLSNNFLYSTVAIGSVLTVSELIYIYSLYEIAKIGINDKFLISNLYILLLSLIICSIVKIITTKINFKISYMYSDKLFSNFYSRYINSSPYSRLSMKDNYISNIFFDGGSSIVNQFILQLSVYIVSFICTLFIIILLLSSLEGSSLLFIFSIFAIFILLTKYTKHIIRLNSGIVSKSFKVLNNIIAISINSYRDIVLNQLNSKFNNDFSNESFKIRSLQAQNQFLGNAPKIIIEITAIILIIIFINLDSKFNIDYFLIIIFSFYNILPYLHSINYSASEILSAFPNLIDFDTIYKNLSPYKKMKKLN